jgi:hypothetical protein
VYGCIQLTRHSQPPGYVCRIEHQQRAQLLPQLQVGQLAAQRLCGQHMVQAAAAYQQQQSRINERAVIILTLHTAAEKLHY